MAKRIDSIYYFNYASNIGYYDSIRDFASPEMEYIGLALSTPKVRVNASPTTYVISSEGSTRIREYAVSQLGNLREISEDLAVNSPMYILICYCDGSKQYFAYNESFCYLFKIASQYQPSVPIHESPYAINRQPQFSEQATTKSIPQSHSYQSPTPQSTRTEKKSFPWRKILLGFGILVFVTIIVTNVISLVGPDDEPNVNAGLQPFNEPISGTILSGSEAYEGSSLTVTASSASSYVVKLKTSSGSECMCFYVRAGETATVRVPRLSLYVYFAAGDTWYGLKHLFGEETSYSMDDEILDFENYSWEYTLYPVTDGNFSQTPIDESAF